MLSSRIFFLTFLITEALENFNVFWQFFGSWYIFNFRMEFSIADHCVTVGIALSACALFARFSSVAKPDALLRQAFLRSYYTSQSHNGLTFFLKSHYQFECAFVFTRWKRNLWEKTLEIISPLCELYYPSVPFRASKYPGAFLHVCK